MPNPYDLTETFLRGINQGYKNYERTELHTAIGGFEYGNLVRAFIDSSVGRAANVEEGTAGSVGGGTMPSPIDLHEIVDGEGGDMGSGAGSNQSGGRDPWSFWQEYNP